VAGLEAARERGAEWVAVLAVDLPRADGRTLAKLVADARAGDLDACMLELERGSQPTFAAYHVRCAPAARAALEAGERRMVSFHSRRVQGRPLRLATRTPAQLGVAETVGSNVNTRAELAELRSAVASGGVR
jgi:molybdopterin-guanine dinucleotide biosynthesis protein A